MSQVKRRAIPRSLLIGVVVTLFVLVIDSAGWLSSFEGWLADRRAKDCQFFTSPPSPDLLHIDIDDHALDAIGRWPWPRATMARLLDEMRLARPRAVGLDIIYSEPQELRVEVSRDGKTTRTVADDDELTAAIKRCGNIVLANAMAIRPPEQKLGAITQATAWLKERPDLTPDAFEGLVRDDRLPTDKKGKRREKIDWPTAPAEVESLFLQARNNALRDLIIHELDAGPVTRETLIARLLPGVDPTVNSPLLRALDSAKVAADRLREMRRFGAVPVNGTVSPAPGTIDQAPIPQLAAAAHACGTVTYDVFGQATVRSIPLFFDAHDKLYPTFGLALACAARGADLSLLRVEGNTVIIPYDGGEIRIPTHDFTSASIGRRVSSIVSVPWFGTGTWETMYDWPEHRSNRAHVSINAVWEACLAEEKIARNNANLDKSVLILLSVLDPAKQQKYAAAPPPPNDAETRQEVARATLADLKDFGILESYEGRVLSTDEAADRDVLVRAAKAINVAVEQNKALVKQLDDRRTDLRKQLGGAVVLVGATATSMGDLVPTSLHRSCPGVVVHGVIANAALTGQWWTAAPPWVAVVLTLLLGLSTAAADWKLTPTRSTACALGLVLVYWVVNGIVLFDWFDLTVDAAAPLATIALVWAVCTLVRLVIEGIERIKLAAEHQFLEREMRLARTVQMALIPAEPPALPGVEAAGWTLPADMTGGDCFDLWDLPDGRLGILVGDASGHGLAPAMIVSQVRTLVRTLSHYEAHPQNLFDQVNKRLALDLPPGRWVTAFLGFMSADGELHWASAGHGPMYYCEGPDDELKELQSTALPLGADEMGMSDPPGPPLKLGPGGALYVFSDGIFESRSPKEEFYETDRLKALFQGLRGKTCKEIIDAVQATMLAWQGKVTPEDDQTMVVVRRLQPTT